MSKRTFVLSITAAGIAGASVFGWVTIRRGFSARDNPSMMEAYVAKTARKLSIPGSERDAKNPFAPTPEVLSEARAHFADHCAICHGNDGSGKTEIGQNLYPKPPDMRLHQTQNLTDGELYYTIQHPAHGDACVGHGGERRGQLEAGAFHTPSASTHASGAT
jgi:cytochrome c553